MNLKPNQHKRISFNTATMTSLGFIGPPPKILGPPLNLSPHQIIEGGGCYHASVRKTSKRRKDILVRPKVTAIYGFVSCH